MIREAGDADQEGVATGKDGGQHPVDRLGLAHDPLRDLGAEVFDGLMEAGELVDVVH